MKHLISLCLSLALSGCQLFPTSGSTSAEVLEVSILCEPLKQSCDLAPWIEYWLKAMQMDWKERKSLIDELGNSEREKLQKILLSQGPATPYQDRLRANYLARELLGKYSGTMAVFIEHLLYLPSKEKLELESALTTMGRLNARQAAQLEQQVTELETQKHQIQQLLELEGQMLDKQRLKHE